MGAAKAASKGSTKVVLMSDVRFASRLARGIAASVFFVGLTVAPPPPTVTPDAAPPATPGAPAPGAPAPGAPAATTPGAPPAAVGPDGLPVPAAPPAMQPKMGPDGKPMMGPDGKPVMEPVPAAAPPPAAPKAADAPPEPPKAKKPINANFFGIPVLIPAEDEYSLYGLFMVAHPVVKVVMIGLAICSVISWAILISKLIYLSALNKRTTNFLNEFRASNSSLQDLSKSMTGKDRSVPPAVMVEAAAEEIDQTLAQGPASTGEKRDHLTQRIASAMSIAQTSRSAELGSGMAFLATVGSIATFVGLFGTVWGIMYSFIGIAQSKSTNLAVVAPGIAEALLATAIGLFAAIPAVIFYNVFARRIAAYNQRLDSFSSELLIRVSRQLDQSAG